MTNPGNKTFFRIYDKESGKIKADLICLHDETFDTDQDMKLFDPNEPWKKTTLPRWVLYHERMLDSVSAQGSVSMISPPVMEIQKICNQEKETLWEENKRFTNPSKIHVDLSQKLYDMKQSLLSEMSR